MKRGSLPMMPRVKQAQASTAEEKLFKHRHIIKRDKSGKIKSHPRYL